MSDGMVIFLFFFEAILFYIFVLKQVEEPIWPYIIFMPMLIAGSLLFPGFIEDMEIPYFITAIGFFILGIIFFRTFDWYFTKLCEKFASKFAGFSAKGADSKHEQALSLARMGNYKESLTMFKDILKEDSEDITAQLRIALLEHLYLKNYHQAIIEYKKLLQMNIKPMLKRFALVQIKEIIAGKTDTDILSVKYVQY